MTDLYLSKRQKLLEEGPVEEECTICENNRKFCNGPAIDQCFFCGRKYCFAAISTKNKSETKSWEFQRILFISRYKEVSSPFYKEKLPMDIFKLILLEVKFPMCVDCADYCPHLRSSFIPLSKDRSKIYTAYLGNFTECVKCYSFGCPGCIEPVPNDCSMDLIGPDAYPDLCTDCSKVYGICLECFRVKRHVFLNSTLCTQGMPWCKEHKICRACDRESTRRNKEK